MRRVIFLFFIFYFFIFSPNEQRAGGGGGGGVRCQTFSFSFFPCSADHERDWPPCKVVFFGLATNALNVRNNNNNNNKQIRESRRVGSVAVRYSHSDDVNAVFSPYWVDAQRV